MKAMNVRTSDNIKYGRDTSRLVYEGYELKKDKYNSFDEYKEELNTWLNLKMKETNLKGELKDVQEQIHELEMKRLTSSGA